MGLGRECCYTTITLDYWGRAPVLLLSWTCRYVVAIPIGTCSAHSGQHPSASMYHTLSKLLPWMQTTITSSMMHPAGTPTTPNLTIIIILTILTSQHLVTCPHLWGCAMQLLHSTMTTQQGYETGFTWALCFMSVSTIHFAICKRNKASI